jgi:hypothetical protein
MQDPALSIFLGAYPQVIRTLTQCVIAFLEQELPQTTPQLDLPAKMIAFTYGNAYSDMICVVIPSQKEVKIGFSKGAFLKDPTQLLEGTGKLSRYVRIKSESDLQNEALHNLVHQANKYYFSLKQS